MKGWPKSLRRSEATTRVLPLPHSLASRILSRNPVKRRCFIAGLIEFPPLGPFGLSAMCAIWSRPDSS
jgi:hypothetical protein